MTIKKLSWVVEFTGCPAIIKRCPKCGEKMRFICSEDFRINANKNKLDVWLIYRCEKCKATHNREIYSRVNPKSLGREEFLLMQSNDGSTARKYAFDKSLGAGKAELDYSRVEFNITGENADVSCPAEIKITAPFAADVKLISIIKGKFTQNGEPVSQSGLLRLFDDGIITLEGYEIGKAKLKKEMIIMVNSGIAM